MSEKSRKRGAKASRAEESASVHEHRAQAPDRVRAAIVTVSDTRTLETDQGGALIEELMLGAGHVVVGRQLVKDEIDRIRAAVRESLEARGVDVILITGGTGIAPRDVTPEAIAPLLERSLPGFGELFRMLSYEEVGPAAMLSRAMAGVARAKLIVALPGSRGAIRTALEELLLPEMGHLIAQARKLPGA